MIIKTWYYGQDWVGDNLDSVSEPYIGDAFPQTG
jgi:hypothetical protein